MRMTPVKTTSALRRITVRARVREIGLRMRELHGDPDTWLPEPLEPMAGSPWALTRQRESSDAMVGSGRAIHVADAEASLRLDAIHDYFVVLRAATTTRSVYGLHVMCRATIEACAFSTWMLDPAAEPAERLLRGLLLREEALGRSLSSMRQAGGRSSEGEPCQEPADVEAIAQTETLLADFKRAITDVRAGLASAADRVPTPTTRIREMLCDDMGMPQGHDAYHRLSGVAHSEATSIMGTWNLDQGKPTIDYFSFLAYLHLALCSIGFALSRRAACWGTAFEATKLLMIIRRVERVIEGEPGVEMT